MSRYVVLGGEKAAASGWDDDPLLPHLYVDGPRLTDTGLVDHNGTTIFRVPPPIGFGRHEEW